MTSKTLTDTPGITSKIRHWFLYIQEGLAGAVICAGLLGILAWQRGWFGGHVSEEASSAVQMAETALSNSVHISPEKIKAASLEIVRVKRQPLRDHRIVPGHLGYDTSKQLTLTAPVDVVVKKVLVDPGQTLKAGDPLVVLASQEVGLARDEVLKREADLSLAKTEHRWAEEIANNVEALLTRLRSQPPLEEIEKEFSEKPLAIYRERLVGEYSRLLFAERVLNGTDDLATQGALSKRVIEERRSNREVAKARFSGACETARFESRREHEKQHALEEQAERLLAISRDNLSVLLGPQGDLLVSVGDSPPPAEVPNNVHTERKLAEFVLKAPFDSRVEERHAVLAGRVLAGGSLFMLADISTLWVEAEIHERDWKVLEHLNQGPIPIRIPALGDQQFMTRIRYVGANVSTQSHSVPLVTEIDNQNALLKPGMFVWVEVPLEATHSALTVPGEAVMRHDQKAFVFVPVGTDEFQRVDVKVGLESTHGTEILEGLKESHTVVAKGAFFLKSELLLEQEAD